MAEVKEAIQVTGRDLRWSGNQTCWPAQAEPERKLACTDLTTDQTLEQCKMYIAALRVVGLPAEETERRWSETAPQWPIVHTVLRGVSRDQFMARTRPNHVNIDYAPTSELVDQALAVKAAMMRDLVIQVHLCGHVHLQ